MLHDVLAVAPQTATVLRLEVRSGSIREPQLSVFKQRGWLSKGQRFKIISVMGEAMPSTSDAEAAAGVAALQVTTAPPAQQHGRLAAWAFSVTG